MAVCSYWSRSWISWTKVKVVWDPLMTDIFIWNHRLWIEELYFWSELVTKKMSWWIPEWFLTFQEPSLNKCITPCCNIFKTDKLPTRIMTVLLNYMAQFWSHLPVIRLTGMVLLTLYFGLDCGLWFSVLRLCFPLKVLISVAELFCFSWSSIYCNQPKINQTFQFLYFWVSPDLLKNPW